MKYLDYAVTFREFPDEISLCINISNCPFHCLGCHSPELWKDVGTRLSFKTLYNLIYCNKGITLIGFMGGNPKEINEFVKYVKNINQSLKVGWYWGGTSIPKEIELELFDYIKIGPYDKELGGLDSPNTNQRFYKIENEQLIDWTYKFWKNEKKG